MLYKEFKGDKLSQLGYGLMRLPVTETGAIDEAETTKLVEYALECGVNYFDTAYPYHGGNSEIVIGNILKNHPRDSFFLADKFPGHIICDDHTPAPIFEEQLQKCQVDYFDYYLLHNVTECSLDTYLDTKWGIMDYFIEQKKQGRIRHLGFSTHGEIPTIKKFLERYGEHLEFCQLQINYVDWTLQQSKEKYDLVRSNGLGVWVMEPVRGGRLVKLDPKQEARLKERHPEYSQADWCFRFVQELPDVYMTLSGMTTMMQMVSNVSIYNSFVPLTLEDKAVLASVAVDLTSQGPQCTACRYCVDKCPMGIDIPRIMELYRDLLFALSPTIGMRIDAMPEGSRPADCIQCGNCSTMCPQDLDIPFVMKDFAERLSKTKSWAQVSKERLEANKKVIRP